MKGHTDILKVGSNEMELVDFRLFKREDGEIYEGIYGINVAKVREIIRLPILTELPGTPHFIEGIFDLRGVVIPIINLAKWMGIDEPEEMSKNARVIITEFNNMLIGFIVHEAKLIRRVNWKDIEPASFIDGGLEGSKVTVQASQRQARFPPPTVWPWAKRRLVPPGVHPQRKNLAAGHDTFDAVSQSEGKLRRRLSGMANIHGIRHRTKRWSVGQLTNQAFPAKVCAETTTKFPPNRFLCGPDPPHLVRRIFTEPVDEVLIED